MQFVLEKSKTFHQFYGVSAALSALAGERTQKGGKCVSRFMSASYNQMLG